MDVTVTTVLAIGLGPSAFVMLSGILLAAVRTLTSSGVQDSRVARAPARER